MSEHTLAPMDIGFFSPVFSPFNLPHRINPDLQTPLHSPNTLPTTVSQLDELGRAKRGYFSFAMKNADFLIFPVPFSSLLLQKRMSFLFISRKSRFSHTATFSWRTHTNNNDSSSS